MEAIKLFFKGIIMGISDALPGISGGTVALVLGIYDRLITSINAMTTVPQRTGIHSRAVLWFSSLPWSFLLPVGLGVGVGVFVAAHSIVALLLLYASPTYSFFIGLLLTTVVVLLMRLPRSFFIALFFIVGFFITFLVTSVWTPTLPTSLTGLFFAGVLAAGIMLLPGPSGSYMLVITGVYTTILGAVQSPFHNILILMVFGAGAIVGLLSVARILGLFLRWFRAPMLALLAGFVAGSLHLLGNQLDATFVIWNIIAVLVSCCLVISLEYWSLQQGLRSGLSQEYSRTGRRRSRKLYE